MKRVFTHLGVLIKASGVVFSLCLTLMLGWISFSPQAIAQPAAHQGTLVAWGVDQPQNANENGIRQGLDNIFGSGTSDRVEGAAKENMGKLKGQVNPDAYQRDGLPTAAEDQAIRDAYTVQDSAKNLADDLGETADKTGDTVRDFFNK